MKPTDQAARRAAEQVRAAGAPSPRRQKRLAREWEKFIEWCEVNDLDYLPTKEQNILRYLEHHDWANYTRETARNAIAAAHENSGHNDPTGMRTDAYMATRRKSGSDKRLPRTEAFTVAELCALANHVQTAHGESARRAVVAIAQATVGVLGSTKPVVQQLPSDAFVVNLRSITMVVGDDRHVLNSGKNPTGFRLLRDWIADHPGGTPLSGLAVGATDIEMAKESLNDVSAIRNRWRYAFNVERIEAMQRSWDAASAADRDWYLSHFINRLHTSRYLMASLLVGTNTGRRAADLPKVKQASLTKTATGYTFDVFEEKGRVLAAQRGSTNSTTYECVVEHVNTNGERPCPLVCPACALERWLEVRRRLGLVNEELFVTPNGEPVTACGLNQLIKRVCKEAGVSAENRALSSRSMRVTAATLAAQSGMSIVDIAANITGHSDLSCTQLYIRTDPTIPTLDVG
ncbi:MAG TPA: hypothetical protein DCQ04_02000 [Actinobacteria bacterium]|jgi:site-specific recombinase XerD|nr:hypothetical protein [Actinomycetota bacterium]